jgi:polyisoprenoid-binding protein YceI
VRAIHFLLLLATVWVSTARTAEPIVYRIIPGSRFDVATGKAGLLSFAGHSHLIRARAFAGRVTYDPGDPARSSVEITVQAAGLEVLTPPDTEEIRKVTTAMRADVLNVERHPEITFVSRRVSAIPDGLHIVGALSIVGKTVEIPVDIRLSVRSDTLHATTQFSVNQTAFGIKPYRGGPGGTVRVADRVKFDIAVVAVRE